MAKPNATFQRTPETLTSQTTTFRSRMLIARKQVLAYSCITVRWLIAFSDVLLQFSCMVMVVLLVIRLCDAYSESARVFAPLI